MTSNLSRKEAARRMKAAGKSTEEIGQELGVHRATICRWLAQYPSQQSLAAAVTKAEDAADSAETATGPLWKADIETEKGTGQIQTGVMPADFDPTDHDAVLAKLGYAPGEMKLTLTNTTRWEQRTAKREWSDKHRSYIRTGDYETITLNAYRYRADLNALNVDLPALYAEVARREPHRAERAPGRATAVVCWADIQTGKVDELGGVDELLARLEGVRYKLVDYLDASDVDSVVVCDVGDIVEGFENTKQQAFTNGLSLMDQIDVAATEFWKTIRACEAFAPVDVLSIPSNHCQWRKGKNLLGRPTDDWGIHINKRLEIQNQEAKLDITFHRPDDWSETLTLDVRGTILGLAHGHQASSPDKVKDWWAKMTHGGVMDCDVLLTGHYHFPSLRPSGRNHRTNKPRWHVQAPTLDNGSAWVRNKMGEDGDPGLCVFQINDDGFDPSSFRLL